MKVKIINLLTDASINGYYDPSIGLVVVWFHKTNQEEQDAVAYLQKDMTWDLRTIKSEKSILYPDKEVIEVQHNPVDIFKPGSDFDVSIRKMLDQLMEHAKNENGSSPGLDIMEIVLSENDYNKIRN